MLDDKLSQTLIATQLRILQSQVSHILKNKEDVTKKWQLNDNLAPKRQRTGKDDDVETALNTWFASFRGHDVPLSGPLLQEKAEYLATRLNKPDFVCLTQ